MSATREQWLAEQRLHRLRLRRLARKAAQRITEALDDKHTEIIEVRVSGGLSWVDTKTLTTQQLHDTRVEVTVVLQSTIRASSAKKGKAYAK